jgi:tRNA dimethylallyltransferase
VGYRELFDYFDSDIEDAVLLRNAVEQIKMNTRRFAKRQMTWFQRTENVSWFDYTTKKTVIIKSLELMIK